MSSLESYNLFDVETGSSDQLLEQMFEDQMSNPGAKDDRGGEGNAGSPELFEQSLSDDETHDSRGSSRNKRKFSKNLLSERKRRQKLNEKLYSLRAIVPKITKMDKASIMADAIGYVEELKSQVSAMRREISAIEEDISPNNFSPNSSLTTASPSSPSPSLEDDHHSGERRDQKLGSLQMDVEKLDECNQTCLVRFRCCPSVLADIVGALESLDLEVLGASVNTFQGQTYTTYMAKVRDERLMQKDTLEGIVSSAVLDSKLCV